MLLSNKERRIYMNDTIAAISTALGVGAISIIRVSGSEAIKIVNSIFKGKDLTKVNTHTINYGHIIDENKIIDEVLVSVMKAPKTFTCENIIEINCHGGIATTKKILELLLLKGCRLAEPGEFTKRAFLNGRIDLIEAEGVMDLIEAKTELSRNVAINQLNGNVTLKIKNLREKLIEIISNIAVNIDYPEYDDVENLTIEKIKNKLNNISNEMKELLKNSENGQIIKEGIKTCIIGRPNVGKSSLLNNLLEEEKAIVTDIEGTTRDIVEGTINLNGILLNIVDTAGIRKTEDIVEKIGVEKSLKLIKESDLVLFMLNNNEELTDEEEHILNEIKNKNHIIIINKIDLPKKLIISQNIEQEAIKISATKNINIDQLKNKIEEVFNLNKIENSDLTYLTNSRSISKLRECVDLSYEIEKKLNDNCFIDLLEFDIRSLWKKLGEIIGETYEEELIDQMFSRFCLGK